MQTLAEKFLIKSIVRFLRSFKKKAYIINLGAAKSTVIENSIVSENIDFKEDRLDIDDCFVDKPYVAKCYQAPLENMSEIDNEKYNLAFANFVFEHVHDPVKCAKEINRILKKEGRLIISLSNPKAPEFILAKYTPTSFHQLFRKKEHDKAHPVTYSYKSLNKLIKIMKENGFKLILEKRFAFTYGYLYRFRFINKISLLYDSLLEKLNLNAIKSHSVMIFEKN